MTQIIAHLIATCAHTWTRLRPGTLKSYETHVPSHLPSQGADVELSVLLLRKADAEGDGAPRASLGLDPPRLDPSASSAISLWANLEMGDRWSNWQRLSLFPGEVFEYDLGDRRQLANWARYFSASLPVVLHVSAITPRAFTATAAAQGVVTAAAAVRASAS